MAHPRIPALCPAWVALAIPLAGALPSATHAQQGCELGPGSELLVRNPDGRGGFITHLTTPHFECDDEVEIWADSAIAYSTDRMSILIGSVRYRDASRELTAREARYFSDVGRLQAQGDVVVVDREDGSRVENGDLVYLRRTDFREEESMTFTTGQDGRRPRAIIPPPEPDSVLPDSVLPDSVPPDSPATPDSATAEPDRAPYTVVGNSLFFRGSDDFTATGDVEIERDSLFAYADSAEYVAASESLVLVGSARVVSSEYELVGRTITMGTASAGANEIRAEREALLTGDDLTLTAPVIKLYLTDGAVERLVAVPLPPSGADDLASRAADAARPEAAEPLAATRALPPAATPNPLDARRPVALAERFELTADSLELTAPGEVVERIFAAGTARSVSQARDSLNMDALPEEARQDWLEGDTIVINLEPARPDSLAHSDTGPREEREREYEIETIVARVGARSLYRLPPQDTTARAGVDLPAVHYVLGDEITIHMSEGEVEAMQVVGQTRGVHLEPIRRTGATGDTIAADTSGVGSAPGRALDGTAGGLDDDARDAGGTSGQDPPRPLSRDAVPARAEPGAELRRRR